MTKISDRPPPTNKKHFDGLQWNLSRAEQGMRGEYSSARKVRLLAYLFLTVITLSSLFLAVQIWNQLSDVRYKDYEQLIAADRSREGGHLLPNMDLLVIGQSRSNHVRWVTNSKGFRNTSEFTYDVPDQTFRILFMGDSYVDGFRTDQDQTIGYGLEVALQKNLCKPGIQNYQVMLSGQNNPAAAVYQYQEHGWKYNPDLVILGITVGNDITPRSYKMYFWPDGNKTEGDIPRLIFDSDRPAAHKGGRDILLPEDAYTEKAPVRDFFVDLEFKARELLAAKLPGLGDIVPPAIGLPSPNKRFHVHAGGNLTSLGLFYDPLLPSIDAWFRDLDEILHIINKQVISNGGELLIVIFPTRAQVDERDWSLIERRYSIDSANFRLNYPNERIVKFCQTEQINCLDLLPGFNAIVQSTGERLYMERGDMHFNMAGQALATRLLTKHICSPSRTYAHDFTKAFSSQIFD